MSFRKSALKIIIILIVVSICFAGKSQSQVSTADFDFYIKDTILLDPSQMELLSKADLAIQKTLTYKAKSDGFKTYYYLDGNKNCEGKSINKKKEGEWISWYDSGWISSKIYYVNDLKEGSCTYWYKNGDLNAIGQYKNNLKDGTWIFYREGKVTGTYIYLNGVIINKVE